MIPPAIAGAGSYEDMNKMGDKFPEMNEYWESKVMPIDNINIPMYNLASYRCRTVEQGIQNHF